MKFTKKLSALALSLALMVSFAACGNGGANDSADGTPVPEDVSQGIPSGNEAPEGSELSGELDIFQFKVEVNDALQAAINTYMEVNPGVKVNLETVGGGDDYGAALRTKMQSSKQPGIFNIGGPQDVMDWEETLEDLSDQPWVPHVVDGLLDDVTKDGEIFGLPFNIEGYGFVYNTKIFEAAGIDATSLKTFDEIDAAFGELKQKIDSGELADEFPVLEAVMEYPVKEKWVTGMHTANIALGQEFANCAEAFNAETVDFTYANELKELIDLQIKYTSSASNPSALNAVDYSMQVGGGLAIERVAVIQQGNWIYPDVASVDEELAKNLSIIPMPLKGVSEGNIPVGVPMYWAVNSSVDDNEKAIAKDFLNWLYQSEEGMRVVIEDFSFIPAFTNYSLMPSDPLGAVISEYANAGNVAPWVFNGTPTGWAENILGAEIQAYVGGEKSWDDIIKTVQDDWAAARA